MRVSVLKLWSLTGAACVLTACTPQRSAKITAATNDLPCFPVEARPWIATTDEGGPGVQRTRGPVSLYVDHSGSMAGYLRAERGEDQPLRDLVATLPSTVDVDSGAVKRVLFGKTLRPLAPGAAGDLLKVDTYTCKDHAPDCDNQESRLDLALGAIAGEAKQNLSFLVSDLWLENSEIKTSGAVALADPLKQILASGRSIAIYGIPAPYTGKVYDLPSHKDVSINAKRPLFLLVVGTLDRLTDFDRQLPRSPSKYLASGVQTGSIKHSLFTLTPGGGAARNKAPFVAVNPATGVSPAIVMSARRGVDIQRLEVRPQGARAAQSGNHPADASLPHWTGPSDDAVLSGAVWRGPVKTRTTVWKLQRDERGRCSAADWMPWGEFSGGWSSAGGRDRATFTLRPDELSAGLAQSAVYLVTGQVVRTSLDTPNPADEWMRKWSFTAEDEAGLTARPPPLFPTLNLSETARLLENVLATAAEGSPTVVGGFSVALKLQR